MDHLGITIDLMNLHNFGCYADVFRMLHSFSAADGVVVVDGARGRRKFEAFAHTRVHCITVTVKLVAITSDTAVVGRKVSDFSAAIGEDANGSSCCSSFCVFLFQKENG